MRSESLSARDLAPSTGAGENLRSKTARRIPVAEGYERWASTYDIDPNPLLAREERYLWPLLEQMHAERVLDLGCGTGRWLRKFAAQGKRRVIGIDSSLPMLRVASTRTEIAGTVANVDSKQLPFPNSFFDLVVSSFVLGHLANLELVVAELVRVTKPGAYVYVTDLHPKAHECNWRVGFRNKQGAFEIESVAHEADALVTSFGSVGFELLQVVDLWLGELEKPIFEEAGKAHLFPQACQVPAILLCQFHRLTVRETQALPVLQPAVPL